MKEEGSSGELVSDLDLDPDPRKILWIRVRQNDADPLDPDPQHWFLHCTVSTVFITIYFRQDIS